MDRSHNWIPTKLGSASDKEAQKFRGRAAHFIFYDGILYEFNVISSPWPVEKWETDLIEPMPKGRGSVCFPIFAIDYFTK